MLTWASLDRCRLRYLRESLDDTEASDCGRCDRCTGRSWHHVPEPSLSNRANDFLRGGELVVEPRKQWPSGIEAPKGRIALDRQARPGRSLARIGDGGWSTPVATLIAACDRAEAITVPDDLITSLAAVLKAWDWDERPTWIVPMPSRRRSTLIDAVADGLGALGRLPVHRALVERAVPDATFQVDQANSPHQVGNVRDRIVIDPARLPTDPGVLAGPVLLIDDEADSRWTLTVAAWELTGAGTGSVLPLVLRTR